MRNLHALALCLLLARTAAPRTLAVQAVEEPFIGWAGETYKPAETVGAAAA